MGCTELTCPAHGEANRAIANAVKTERKHIIAALEAEARMTWQTDSRRAGLRRAVEVIRERGR